MFRVFVSYATQDLNWVDYLQGLLSSPGVEVYISEYDLDPGESLSTRITKQITDANLFVLIWSQSASDSLYVQKEVFYAKGQGKHILPVAIQASVPLPAELGDVKYLDIAKNPQAQSQWLRDHVGSLARSKDIASLVQAGLLALLGFALFKAGE